jgi:predicted murein hydrolase (TIGR00659 family)
MMTRLWTTPLPGVLLTVTAYALARRLQKRAGGHALLNPVLLASLAVIAALRLTHTPYSAYASSARLLLWLLGPATVALAVPLAHELPRLRQRAWPILASVCVGAFTAATSGFCLSRLTGANLALSRALALKSATTPIAMGVAEKVGAAPELTAVLVVCTGVLGATLGPLVLGAVGARAADARGIATGTAAHGIGTSSLYRSSPEASAYSGLGMALCGLVTALASPWLLPALERLF